MRLVRVPLRISLVGGGTDIPSHYEEHGGGVLSFTINKYIYITAKKNTHLFPHKYRLVYSQVEECNDRSEIQHPIIRRLVNHYGIGSLDLDVMSDIPAGTGMGSSSAFTVGMHLALNPLNQADDKQDLAELACITEIEDLKEPIGKQDQYAASFGGLNYYRFTEDRITVNPVSLSQHELWALRQKLTLVYIGGNRSASTLLKKQSNQCNVAALKRMTLLATDCARELHKGNMDYLGRYIYEGWLIKRSLSPNVSNDRIDTIISTAMANGATGGKLLGAGGAGFVLLVCPYEDKDTMIEGLSKLKLTYVPFEMDKEGAKVLYED